MNSINWNKSILNLSLCLITVMTLTSCSSGVSREVAQEKARVEREENSSTRAEYGAYPPETPNSKRFQQHSESH
jgi:hypothetical protein